MANVINIKRNVFISIVFFSKFSFCWDLSYQGIKDDYYTSSVALFKNRAFLTLPRSSCYNDITYPTVIEVPWAGGRSVRVWKPLEFPSNVAQTWGDCDQIQDGIYVAVQEAEARLWLLDAGSAICNPKVIVYDLNFDVEFQKFQLVGVPHGTLTSLVIDSSQHDNGLTFVGSKNANVLFALSLEESLWWEINLIKGKTESKFQSEILAISPTKPVLFGTNSKEDELYQIKLNEILENYRNKNFTTFADAEYVGNKLGISGGMMVDLKGGLIYYLIRDYAIVRWDTSQELKAESHNVLAQSFRALPFVSCIFTGPHNGVWALVNPNPPVECPTNKKNSTGINNNEFYKLRTRTIQILKYIKKD